MTTLTELLERVERAEGPDRALDGFLAVLAGWEWHGDGGVENHEEYAGHWVKPGFPTNGSFGKRGPGLCDCHTIDPRYGNSDDVPAYTASLDAAIPLRRKSDFVIGHKIVCRDGSCDTELWTSEIHGPVSFIAEREDEQEALCFCAALLKALIAVEEKS